MWLKWLPWQFIVRRLARSHGFMDPIAVLSYLRRFSQPSEVQEPIELLRAGVVLHARGLMNSRAIQHNLDWVWPFWVERQFNPRDVAFVPRAFSLTHINLTHRNWTAVGIPDVDAFPLVDPAGALMPLDDGWTLDAWVIGDDGTRLTPSRVRPIAQRLDLEPNLAVVTDSSDGGLALNSRVAMALRSGEAAVEMRLGGRAETGGWLAVALRPCNAEGVSFIHKIAREGDAWNIEGQRRVLFDSPIERHAVSNYTEGDVAQSLPQAGGDAVTCEVGMATAAALFRIEPGQTRDLTLRVPLEARVPAQPKPPAAAAATEPASAAWQRSLAGVCRLRVPDPHIQFLYDAALRTLVLHSPGDVYPGPFTYRRFWFRDAALILNAMLMAGMIERSERTLNKFPERQTAFGFFHSQEGEWDSNGEALWIMRRFLEVTGRQAPSAWLTAAERGALWIERKRLPKSRGPRVGGLLPAGFSAEHLGPNDFYYWDDFWSVAGLEAAAATLRDAGNTGAADTFMEYRADLLGCIEGSLALAAERLGRPAMPAAPSRRLDAGAIGSVAAGYPLRIWQPDDARVLDTAEWLMSNCFERGGFFQDMIHSGINAYLTLHIAQVLMRDGDARHWELAQAVAALASPTGQWPEAIHPHTGGGCMGDGQHVWAAAEWIAMLRNMFVLEEADRLVLGAGIPPEWLAQGEPLELGPTPTRWGAVTVRISPGEEPKLDWEATWHAAAPPIEVRLAGRPARQTTVAGAAAGASEAR